MGKGERESHTRAANWNAGGGDLGWLVGWLGGWLIGHCACQRVSGCASVRTVRTHQCEHSSGSCGGGSAGGAKVGWCERHVRDHPLGLSEVVQTDMGVSLHQLCTLVAGCQPQRSVQQRNGRVEVPAIDRALSLFLQLLDRVDQPDLLLRRGILGVEILQDVGVPTRCNI